MSSQSGMNDSNNKNKRTKPTTAIPMAGAIVTAAALLLSGLSLISNNNYQPAIAQSRILQKGAVVAVLPRH